VIGPCTVRVHHMPALIRTLKGHPDLRFHLEILRCTLRWRSELHGPRHRRKTIDQLRASALERAEKELRAIQKHNLDDSDGPARDIRTAEKCLSRPPSV